MSASYLPHGECFLWNRQLIALHVVSDAAIFLSYMTISISLAWLAYFERQRIPFNWMLVAFGLFIVACGFTHAMDIIVLWDPLYWLAGGIKLVTAVASVTTAVLLPFIIPAIRRLVDEAGRSRRNERRFVAAAESNNDAFFILESERDGAGVIVDFRFAFANARGAELISATPASLQGSLLCATYPVNRTDGYFEKYKGVVESGIRLEEEVSIAATGINASWLFIRVHKLDDGVAITTTDISARKRNELDLQRLLAFRQSMIASSPFATIVTDPSGIITSLNPAAEHLLGYDASRFLDGETALLFLDPQEIAARAATLSEELGETIAADLNVLAAKPRRGLVEESEWKFIQSDGARLDVSLTVSAIAVESGEIAGLMLVVYDLTERKRSDARAAYVARHDGLTGLPNRQLFGERLASALESANANQHKVALLMVDLDNFKNINDSMGHRFGDEVLAQIAKRLSEDVRESDTVARLGGDEFVVVLDGIENVLGAERMARRLLRSINLPIALGAQAVVADASIGIALYPDHGENAETLLANADAAMYWTKGRALRHYGTYTSDMAFKGL
jgi:diguanylate cyclase (GGDEF)-like protein/PAS domain S-box-containing protein